jgi:hypothetical protein
MFATTTKDLQRYVEVVDGEGMRNSGFHQEAHSISAVTQPTSASHCSRPAESYFRDIAACR